MHWVSTIVMATSLIFEAQLNVHLRIGTVYVSNSSDTWDKECAQFSVDNIFRDFGRWEKPSTEASWFLFDDCFRRGSNSMNKYPSASEAVLGAAKVSGLCDFTKEKMGNYRGTDNNIAMVFYNRDAWLVMAHELGHLMGASHSFENGIGTTGGIMDYGNWKSEGKYMFSSNRTREICGKLTQITSNCDGKFRSSMSGGFTLTPYPTGTLYPTVSSDLFFTHRHVGLSGRSRIAMVVARGYKGGDVVAGDALK